MKNLENNILLIGLNKIKRNNLNANMIKLNFCVNCGATPHYKKKCNNFCSVKCEKEYFNKKKQKYELEK